MLTVSEAAILAGRGEETIRRWVRTGRLDARRDGHRLLLYDEQVEAVAGARGSDLPPAWRPSWLRRDHDWVARVRRSRGER